MKTMDRATLVAELSRGEHPAEAAMMVEDVLARLGWASKETFVQADIPVILMRIADDAQGLLDAQTDPALQETARDFARLLAPVKDMVAQAADARGD